MEGKSLLNRAGIKQEHLTGRWVRLIEGQVVLFIILLSLLLTSGCGRKRHNHTIQDTTISKPGPDGYIVIARASLPVTIGSPDLITKLMNSIIAPAYANPVTQPVTVVLAGATSMSMSNSNFSIPPMTNDILDFGTLTITSLFTNDLKKCGNNGNQKCTKALLRIYTTGAGAGFWNSFDGYGMPLLANNTEVGLNASGSVIMQTYNIPNNRNTVTLSNFPSPTYSIKGDFTNAGAGSYGTTINVELALGQ